MPRVICSLLFAAVVVSAAHAATVPPELAKQLEQGPRPVWVFFTDKGTLEGDDTALIAAAARLSERTLARRARVSSSRPPVRWIDLSNEPAYLRWFRDHGLEIRAESRWLAAVSVVADAAALELLVAAPFVARLQPVGGAGRRDPHLAPLAPGKQFDQFPPLDYGPSEEGLAQINVPAVHELGYSGEGVVVGMLDTGFDLTHEALAGIDVLGAWDFINNDGIVFNEPGESDFQAYHGTVTLSVLAGYMPGQLIGPAYGASYYLAKTEDTTDEVPAEEDFWVEGIEWLEANGCDVVSSSLVYDDWYTFDDFDGNTCVTTIAADLAVSLGVALFNSAGNYRQSTGTIGAPADGDSVITVGAVEITGEIASFSSPGPTADGRIKPDVCALGVDVVSVVPYTADMYASANGTSMSCPLAAGVGALLLDAFPGASPLELREALRSTASQAGAPDNDYGWGIIDALAALEALEVTATSGTDLSAAPAILEGNWPNPFNPRTVIGFSLTRDGSVSLQVHDVAGRLVRHLATGERLAAGRHERRWDGRDEAGREAPSGVYLVRLAAGGTVQTGRLTLVR